MKAHKIEQKTQNFEKKRPSVLEALIKQFSEGKMIKPAFSHEQYLSNNAQKKQDHFQKQNMPAPPKKCQVQRKINPNHIPKTSVESTNEGTTGFTPSQDRMSIIKIYESTKKLIVKFNLYKQYRKVKKETDLETINKIIYNEKSHVVAIFKDFLIYDDIKEFIVKQHNLKEIKRQLLKLCKPVVLQRPKNIVVYEKSIFEKAKERKEKIRKIKEEDNKKGAEGSTFLRTGFMDELAREDLLNSRSNLPSNSLNCSEIDPIQFSDLLKLLNENDVTNSPKAKITVPPQSVLLNSRNTIIPQSSNLSTPKDFFKTSIPVSQATFKIKPVKSSAIQPKNPTVCVIPQKLTLKGNTRSQAQIQNVTLKTMSNDKKSSGTLLTSATNMHRSIKTPALETYYTEHYQTPVINSNNNSTKNKNINSGGLYKTGKNKKLDDLLSVTKKLVSSKTPIIPYNIMTNNYVKNGTVSTKILDISSPPSRCASQISKKKSQDSTSSLFTIIKKEATNNQNASSKKKNSRQKRMDGPHSSAGIYFATNSTVPAKAISVMPLNQKSTKLIIPKDIKVSASRNSLMPPKPISSVRTICCSQIGYHKTTNDLHKLNDGIYTQKAGDTKNKQSLFTIKIISQHNSQKNTPRGFEKNLKARESLKHKISNIG